MLKHGVAARGNPVTRGFNRAVDWTIEATARSLEWVLRYESLTLVVTVGTLAATVWLYIIIPKGFLPLQDTGLIFAVMEGGEEVSFTEMQRLRAAVETADPQGSRRRGRRVGRRRDADQRHPQCRPARHHAAAAQRAQGHGRADHRTAASAWSRRSRASSSVFPAGAGHPDFDPRQPRAVPVHADRRRREGRERMGGRARRPRCRRRRCCATSPPRPRTKGCG